MSWWMWILAIVAVGWVLNAISENNKNTAEQANDKDNVSEETDTSSPDLRIEGVAGSVTSEGGDDSRRSIDGKVRNQSEADEPIPVIRPQDSLIENLDAYASCTKNEDWAGIAKLNGIELDTKGATKELGALSQFLEKDEIIFALASGVMTQTGTSNASDFGLNTWLIVLTNERFLCLDHSMFGKSIDTQSVRLDKVQAVSASQGWMLGKIMIDLGSRVIVIDNCQKADVRVMADIANTWLKHLPKLNTDKSRGSLETSNDIRRLEELARLHRDGVLSEDEFLTAKQKIIESM